MSTYFGFGVPAASTKFLWNERSLSATPDAENVNTQKSLRQAGNYRALAILSVAPGAGESVTIAPVINGSDSAGSMVVSGTAKGASMAIPESISSGDTLSFKSTLSAGSADVGNIQVSIKRTP